MLAAAALALAVGSIAAGCGGGDDSTRTGATGATGAQGPPDQGRLPRQGERDLQEGESVAQPGGQQFFKSLGLKQGEQPTSEQIQQFATETAIPNIQAQITAIEALPAPSGDEDQVTAITDSAQEALDKMKADPSLLEQGNSSNDPFADVDKLAKQYGLDQCAN